MQNERIPYSLYVGGNDESQIAIDLMSQRKIPVSITRTTEGKTPALVTPVGVFEGIDKINLYTPSFHETVTDYLNERARESTLRGA